MRYTYAYKTSDGTRHEASVEAESREAVFAALRAEGIKPIKVVAADGSKANGEIRGVRKRVVAAIAIGAAMIAGVVAYFANQQLTTNSQQPTTTSPRHQIYGDPVIVAEFERGNFESALTNRADQMLAWFAQPGKLMCPKGIDLRRCADEFVRAVDAESFPRQNKDGENSIRRGRDTASTDSREVRELRQIVAGMCEEMREYLANGNGTPRSYWRRLLERTTQEMQIYERTRRELEKEKSAAVWEEKNEALRRLGLRTIPNPSETE